MLGSELGGGITVGVVVALVGASWFATGTLEGERRGKTVGVKGVGR